MKKSIIIAAALLSMGILSSPVKATKVHDQQTLTLQKLNAATDRKDIATAD